MSISPKRILYLDEVRSLAIMLVVIGHVSRLFSYDFYSWLFCSGVFSLTRIGVPLFFTVSGSLLLTRKYEVKKFLGGHIKADAGLDYRDFYSMYTVRRDNARSRARLMLEGPKKTLEDYFIQFVTEQNKEKQNNDSFAKL